MITVTMTTHGNSSSNAKLFNKMEMKTTFKYIVDFDGNVKKAYYVNNKGKETAPKILQPGMQGYFDFDYSSLPTIKLKDESGAETEYYIYVQVVDTAKMLSEMGMNPTYVHATGYTKTLHFISKTSDSVKFKLLGILQEGHSTMDDYTYGHEGDTLYIYEGTQLVNSNVGFWMVENGNRHEKITEGGYSNHTKRVFVMEKMIFVCCIALMTLHICMQTVRLRLSQSKKRFMSDSCVLIETGR